MKQNETKQTSSFLNPSHQSGQQNQDRATLPLSNHCFTNSCSTVVHSNLLAICPLNLTYSSPNVLNLSVGEG